MRVRARAVLAGAALLVCVIAGCTAETGGPPEVFWGHDRCSACGMILSERRHAAAVKHPDGTVALFDDLGEALATLRDQGVDPTVEVFLHDYRSEAWIDASSAWVVFDPTLQTPMGSGTIAFAKRADAVEFATPRAAMVRSFRESLDEARPVR